MAFLQESHHFRILCLAFSGSQRSASLVSEISFSGWVRTDVLMSPSHLMSMILSGRSRCLAT